MYGTIAHMRLVPGAEEMFRAYWEALSDNRMPGWVTTAVAHAADDPDDVWLFVLFEDEESYQKNANSKNQDARYVRMRACLVADPEWHDINLISRAERPAES
jgi:heme-degrading monooxygenase HmoA